MKNHPFSPCDALVCASFVLLLVAPVAVVAAADTSYALREKIFVSCGVDGPNFDGEGRNWTGDAAGSKFAPSFAGNSVTAPQASSVPTVPFLTARVFTSPSTYSFPLTPGRIFLRLYFYPSQYSGNLSSSDAFFSATAGPHTLLHNFSASMVADSINFAYVILEYSLNVTTTSLNLTFTPVKTHNSKSFAFVNGIEIVPIPDLFSSQNAMLVSGGDPVAYEIDSDQALQTLYRLNVGGQAISPSHDSGLFRSWADDSQYIFGAAFGVTFSKDSNVTIAYGTLPNYTAPADVYSTARSMGPNAQINLNYNLSWFLPVDAGFQYLVRLHFCEIQYPITMENQRVFDIYLSNQTAQGSADVIAWSGGIGIPVYKDYVVLTTGSGQMDLWVALHPELISKPQYYDAILNGLEVFKLQNSNSSLAGLNPEPVAKHDSPTEAPSQKSNKKGAKLIAVVGGVVGGGIVVLLAALFVILKRKQQKKKKQQQQQKEKEKEGKDGATSDGTSALWPSLYGNSHSGALPKTNTGSHGSSLPSNLCRYFTIAEIRAATNDFDESLLLGVGGFGKVYSGMINGGSTKVAIKRGNPISEQGVHEFQTEIETLSKLRHRHLVSLIGYCEDNCEMVLVYDFMAHGTLREHLYSTQQKPPLPWKQRLEICIGAARGLHYLHTGAKYTIIHRDVKTTNILLDDKWVAKVSDFGLSKMGPAMDDTHVSTVVKGSFGYLDPEYFRRQRLTEKSDVYSFGVVLFEVLCARPALIPSLPKEQVNLADWALYCLKKGVLEDIIDPYLKDRISPQCFRKFAETAEKCVSDVGMQRPSMGDVLWNLEFALQLQESAEESGNIIGGISDDAVALLMARKREANSPIVTSSGATSTTITMASIGDRSITSEESDRLTPSAVFSQILNPNGR